MTTSTSTPIDIKISSSVSNQDLVDVVSVVIGINSIGLIRVRLFPCSKLASRYSLEQRPMRTRLTVDPRSNHVQCAIFAKHIVNNSPRDLHHLCGCVCICNMMTCALAVVASFVSVTPIATIQLQRPAQLHIIHSPPKHRIKLELTLAICIFDVFAPMSVSVHRIYTNACVYWFDLRQTLNASFSQRCSTRWGHTNDAAVVAAIAFECCDTMRIASARPMEPKSYYYSIAHNTDIGILLCRNLGRNNIAAFA